MASALDQALDSLQGDDAALMGALQRRAAARGMPMSRSAQRLTEGFATAGVPKIGMRRQLVPFGTVTFTATSGTNLTFSSAPTKNVIGKKLVASVTRTGASASAGVFLGFFTIGSTNQFISNQACPIETFSPEVQGNEVDFDQAQAGIEIQAGVSLQGAALAGADTIVVALAMLGDTIG
jgi:hypothetical protein